MILFNKKFRYLMGAYAVYIAIINLVTALAQRVEKNMFVFQMLGDKTFTYFIVPPFAYAISLIDESITKPYIIRMENRQKYLYFLLIQQYLFAAFYILMWMIFIACFAKWNGNTEHINYIDYYFRYLLGLLIFVNLSDFLKRLKIKFFAAIPFVATYLLLVIEVLALAKIANTSSLSIYLVFSWIHYWGSFGHLALIMIYFVLLAFLQRQNCKADIL